MCLVKTLILGFPFYVGSCIRRSGNRSVLTRDCAQGGSNDRISLCWSKKHEGLYDEATDKAIIWSHWQQIKSALKLSNKDDHPKKGDDGYQKKHFKSLSLYSAFLRRPLPI